METLNKDTVTDAKIAPTVIYLVRHGEIDANVAGHWFGSTDQELNLLGEHQAAQLGSRYDESFSLVSAIYSSPLKRTLSTARGLSGDRLPVTMHAGLREYGIGDLEGLAFEVLASEHDFFGKIHQDQNYAPQGGESINQVRDRMLDALQALRQAHVGETIVVVSHGAAMAIVLSHLLHGSPYPFDNYHMSNTGVSELVWDETWDLRSFNQTHHLTAAAPPKV